MLAKQDSHSLTLDIRKAIGPDSFDIGNTKIVEHPENEEHSCTVIVRKESKDSSASGHSPQTTK